MSLVAEAYIVAPNLKKVAWRDDPYDPSRHQLAVVNRHLQQLWIKQTSMLRMRLFDTVNELRLDLSISQVCPHSHSRARTWISTWGIADYEFSILLRQHFLEFFLKKKYTFSGIAKLKCGHACLGENCCAQCHSCSCLYSIIFLV